MEKMEVLKVIMQLQLLAVEVAVVQVVQVELETIVLAVQVAMELCF